MMARDSHRPSRFWDVAVVGGSIAGLAAAAYLAGTGTRVVVLERASSLGGRAATQRRGGYSFNRGAHALYSQGQLTELLDDLNVAYSGSPAPSRALAWSGGERHILPATPLALLSTRMLGLRDKFELGAWFARLPRLDAKTLAHCSVTEWLKSSIRSPHVERLMHAFVRLSTYVNAPDLLSAETAILQLQKALGGVIYVDDGWQSLVDGLAEKARSRGAILMPSCRVTALAPETSTGYALSIHGEPPIGAKAVVLAVQPKDAARLVGSIGEQPPRTDAPAVHAAVLDVGLARLPDPRTPFLLDIDEPLYAAVHSESARLAPEGRALVHVAKYLNGPSDPERDRRELEGMLDRMQPGWQSVERERQFLPDMAVASRLDQSTEGGHAGRPAVDATGLPGVFLAGDWIGREGWLADAAAASARAAARAVSRWLAPGRIAA